MKDASRSSGFDFTERMRLICEDMVARVDELTHIDMTRVAVSFRQTRSSAKHGMYASLTPLRFEGGLRHTVRRGRKWGMPRVCDASGREVLYILSFYLPRFLELSFRDKLDTVTHELWHVSPKCDGDLRRHAGRCFAHGHSQKAYDAHATALAKAWLAAKPPSELTDFLRLSFRQLTAQFGRVHGKRYTVPKLVRLD